VFARDQVDQHTGVESLSDRMPGPSGP
jgi:hypothetical protein